MEKEKDALLVIVGGLLEGRKVILAIEPGYRESAESWSSVLGSVVSMGIISIFISLPFSISGRVPRLNRVMQVAAGILSIAFGLVLMYQIGITEGLLVRT